MRLLLIPAVFGVISGVFSSWESWNSSAYNSKMSVIIEGVKMGAAIAVAILVMILVAIFLGTTVFGFYEWCEP